MKEQENVTEQENVEEQENVRGRKDRNGRVRVRIAGELALFTRPELKVERVSYSVLTPSAARGILEAVLWKPQMRWEVRRITVLHPPRFLNVRRNEVASKIPASTLRRAGRGLAADPYYADDDRRQRNTLLLRDVAYVVEATMGLTAASGPADSIEKYSAMFHRRVRRGQHHQQPYLGCREMPAEVTLAEDHEVPSPALRDLGTVELGWMLLDVDHRPEGARPLFFRAVMREGVIDVPSRARVAALARGESVQTPEEFHR